jgi:hypothetical protein
VHLSGIAEEPTKLARHVSQPTVSRIRQRLEEQRYIDYTGVPNLRKLGFELVAMTFGNWKYDQ